MTELCSSLLRHSVWMEHLRPLMQTWRNDSTMANPRELCVVLAQGNCLIYKWLTMAALFKISNQSNSEKGNPRNGVAVV